MDLVWEGKPFNGILTPPIGRGVFSGKKGKRQHVSHTRKAGDVPAPGRRIASHTTEHHSMGHTHRTALQLLRHNDTAAPRVGYRVVQVERRHNVNALVIINYLTQR